MDKNKKPDNPYAFACIDETFIQHGMTLRDYFAAIVLNGTLSNSTIKGSFGVNNEESNKGIAEACYSIADAMLKQREL